MRKPWQNRWWYVLKPLPEDTTGVNEFVAEGIKYVSVYPNPAKDFVKLSVVGGYLSVVKIYNMMGMLIDEFKFSSEEVEIDVSNYNSGIYSFNIDGETFKIIRN